MGGVLIQTLAVLTNYATQTVKYSRTQTGTLMNETDIAQQDSKLVR